MSTLPISTSLPIEHLSASFDNVTNSYKFYWFLAILDHVRKKQTRVIPVSQLTSCMIAQVWYPTNYFRLSFGKQDRLGRITLSVGASAVLPIDSKQSQVIQTVLDVLSGDSALSREIESLQTYVPYRFLRPFFSRELIGFKDAMINSKIEKLAASRYDEADSPCLYRFTSTPEFSIEIHPTWFEYLYKHLSILTGFCMWHLVAYLQKNNPNVPGIPSKLEEPSQRNLKHAKELWKIAFEKLEKINCIYSGQEMMSNGISLDHFLPWRFVAHDLLWNIVPAPRKVNSAKSDNLPSMERYFEGFANIQYLAVQAAATVEKTSLLEDHILLAKVESARELKDMPLPKFREILYDTLAPQIQIATNMGFVKSWEYK